MAKSRRTIQCRIPTYQKDRSEWRKAILANVLNAANGAEFGADDQLEVVILLYLSQRKRLAIHDVDNRLKDILDALQGRFGKSQTDERLINNDNQVRRVLIEKQKVPKAIGDDADDAGGRLLIRPYEPHRWPLQSTSANRVLRKRKPRS